jgi:hypothetical protein
MLRAQERTGDVDVHRRHEVVQRELEEREDLGDAGAVDEHVAAAVALLQFGKGTGHGLRVAHVDGLRLGLEALCAYFRRRLFGRLRVAVGHDDRHAGRGQPIADVGADAHRAAGDEGHARLGCCLLHAALLLFQWIGIHRAAQVGIALPLSAFTK